MNAETGGGALLEDAERIENWAVVVVIGAITIEGLLVFASNEPWLFKIGDFIANVAVALAILIELKFGGVVAGVLKGRLAEAEREAGEARERAARIELLIAPRRLSPEQFQQITGAFRGRPEISVWVEFQTSDQEALIFADQVARAIDAAGPRSISFNGNSFLSGNVFGTHISLAPEIEGTTAIEEALSSFGRLERARRTDGPTTADLWDFVGPKEVRFEPPSSAANTNPSAQD